MEDARQLSYPDCVFDQVLYLGQVICFLDDERGRREAIAEAHRITKVGGLAIFSFLCYESRLQSGFYRALVAYLYTLRMFKRGTPYVQSLPWFRVGAKMNFHAILDRPPYVYWFRIGEAVELLKSCGFNIAAVGTRPQIENNLYASADDLSTADIDGMLYVICRK